MKKANPLFLKILSFILLTAFVVSAGVPGLISYQGNLSVSGTSYSGTDYFKFALVDSAATTTHWSNDGTSSAGSEPTASIQLTVSSGLFSVNLGDTTLANNDANNSVIGFHTNTADLSTLQNIYKLVKSNSTTTALVVDGSGNVGVGTTNPGVPLEVDGSGTSLLLLKGSGGAGTWLNLESPPVDANGDSSAPAPTMVKAQANCSFAITPQPPSECNSTPAATSRLVTPTTQP